MQTIYQEKGTQTEPDTMEEILKAITTLSAKVDSMDKELQKMKNISQQHDYKHAELRRSADGKQPELKGDDGKLHKFHNGVCLNAATSSTSTAGQPSKKEETKVKYTNINMNKLFFKTIYSSEYPKRYIRPSTNKYLQSQSRFRKTNI